MNKITFPLDVQMQGPEVRDLQAALQLLLDRGVIPVANEDEWRRLSAELQREHTERTYKETTRELVKRFQKQRGLAVSGAVDEPTANAINAFLREQQPDAQRSLVVSGQVQREDGLPFKGGLVRAFHETERGAIRLGEDMTDTEGRYTIRYDTLPEVTSIHLRVSVSSEDGTLLQSSELIRDARPLEIVNLTVPLTEKPVAQRRIEGRISLEDGLPAENIRLRLYRRDFGSAETLLSETTTREDGLYALPYDVGGKAASLEVRAVDAAGGEIPLSKTMHDLSEGESTLVSLVAPATLQPLAAEYQRLTDDLTPHVGEIAKLADARENAERQDLTLLNRATGWDARLIALASNAAKLSADAEVGLSQEVLYGLFRAGLPSDKLQLARVSVEAVDQALTKGQEAGIVNLSVDQVAQVKTQFETFSREKRLAVPAPGSRSTYSDLLKASGLNDNARTEFTKVYLNHRGDAAQLWKDAKAAGVTDDGILALQRQGKLAFLAGNSEGMTVRLMRKQMNDPVQLVDQDFYRPDTWLREVFEQAEIPEDRRNNLTDADRKKLEGLIPTTYAAEKVEDRLSAYAEDMARKVRLSYPTQVVGHMVEQDTTDAFKLGDARPTVTTLLKNAAAKGFRLGQTPVESFVRDHSEVLNGIDANAIATAQQGLKTLQRVYQITPSNEAMPILLSLGLTSAYDVVALSQDEFLDRYGHKFPSREQARLVHCKAEQVCSVTYNLFTIAKKLDSEAPVYGMSAPVEVRESVKNELIKQFPTMESLFGSMDFCECEHCRSVLSPAAYLVDLLQFVDPEPEEWARKLAHWKDTHNGQDYTAKYQKPYDALIERRPDLRHIPLTCENTHTALPYIDVVNEILEYYVANDKLDDQAAHDTGDATTAELLAEPQNVIRQAYDKLREARYPLNLPFDLWIETVRQFCNYFETRLDRVLETFRTSDALFAPAQAFDRGNIFMESLGLSPAEVPLLTTPDPLAKWHELYGFDTAARAMTEATDATTGQRIDLNSAKALSRRLGVTYKELAEIVQTGFVNPRLARLRLLYTLRVSIHDARFYLDHKGLLGQDPLTLSSGDQKRQLEVAAFSQALGKLAETFQVTTAQLEAELLAMPFDDILMLADPDAGCNFDLTTLQYADGAKADPIAFLRINLFVRLWRKLGWSIEETDRVLSAFMPQSAPFDDNPANLAKQPLKTALVYLAHLKRLDEKLRVGKQSRLKLLTLWSDLATTGKQPLYAQLFLTRSVLKSDPVFDHPLGQYLTDPNVKLKEHVLALQGALALTADEIGRILADGGKSLDTAELSLPNASLLYRYSLLAKALKLSVRELIALKQLSGLDPFKPLHPDPLATIEEDHPFSQTLRLVEIADEVKDSGLTIEDLDYLLRHRFDETGTYRPNREGMLALLTTLADGIRAIRAEHAVPDDPGAMGEDVLRQKLGLALPPDVVETFLAMMNGTAEFTASKTAVEPANKLDPTVFEGEERVRELSYKEVPHREQKLTVRGVLFPAQRTELETRFNAVLTAAQRSVFTELLGDIQVKARQFFEKYLQKQAPNIQPAAGFLGAADFDPLFNPSLPLVPGETEQDRIRSRRSKVANAFLPFLQERRIRQFIVQTMTAHTVADAVLVESLITDERLLAVAGPKPLLALFASTSERGVDAAFFDSGDLSGVAQAVETVVGSADTSLKDTHDAAGNPLNPANSARFEGYLEVPTPGAYRFYVELDKQNAGAELRFDHLPHPEFLKGTATAANAGKLDNLLELKSGIPYRFSLELKKLDAGGARLLVQGETLPKGGISQVTLYPLSAIAGAERAIVLLTKALEFSQSLGLSEREMRYLLTHAADFDNVNLSQLPTQAVGDTPADKVAATERFTRFLRLAAYMRLKRDLAVGTDDLIDIFEANSTGDLGSVYALIAKLTRRDEATVKASAEALVAAPGYESEKPLVRLWETLQVVERFGAPVASLLAWTRIVSTSLTPEQRFEIARDLKEAIKARFEPETWHRVAQPIFDKLRQRQRDALVSHVMHQHGFDRMEQLYEYFLIDPGMEPVVQTSRIRLAIASVQLFIQRCLLNLELKVHPSTINSKHWEWMKRYRVWEANRKIFLFPENWLEPEFRDDKTHLFTELEGALLQGDVSSDLVEDAFLNYLKKLEELARLDIVAMHLEDKADPTQNTLHVIGRTYSQPHNYFYRRYAHEMWTHWEPVTAEIEGAHLAPVVWRDRLYLFWVTFMDKPDENAKPGYKTRGATLADANVSDLMSDVKEAGAKKQIDVQLHWSAYLHGEWSTGESSGLVPVMTTILTTDESGWLGTVAPMASQILLGRQGFGALVRKRVPLTVSLKEFHLRDVCIHVSKQPYEDGEERGVFVHLEGPENFQHSFYLASRNSAPEAAGYSPRPNNPYSANTPRATRYAGSGALSVELRQRITTEDGKPPVDPLETLPILSQGGSYTLLPCNNTITLGSPEIASLVKPQFYQDNDMHTLFIEASVVERTIEEWQEWVTHTPQPDPEWVQPDWWENIVVIPALPRQKLSVPIDPSDPVWRFSVDRESLFKVKPGQDWVVNPVTGLLFDGELIGPGGRAGWAVLPSTEVAGAITEGGIPVNVHAGSGLAPGDTVVLTADNALDQAGLTPAAGGLNVVGSSGFNSALAQNFDRLNRSGSGVGNAGAGRIRR